MMSADPDLDFIRMEWSSILFQTRKDRRVQEVPQKYYFSDADWGQFIWSDDKKLNIDGPND